MSFIFSLSIGSFFTVVHHLLNGNSFRSPEYFWYYGIAKNVVEPYGATLGRFITLKPEWDITQYILRGFYHVFPSMYSVQAFAFVCYVLVGIIAYFFGSEVFYSDKHRDLLGLMFSSFLIILYPLLFLYIGVFTHDTLQMVFVLSVLFLGTRFLNRKDYRLLPVLSLMFLIGLGINMSIVFTVPILALYYLRGKNRFLLWCILILLFSVVGDYFLMQRFSFGNLVDVLPIKPLQVIEAYAIPLTFAIVALYKTIKDRDIFLTGSFLYLFIAMCFMSRNIRWVTIPIALLLTYLFKSHAVYISEKSLYKKIKHRLAVILTMFLIFSQTLFVFMITDTPDEAIDYGVHAKEIEYTEEFFEFVNTVYKDTKITILVEPDRQSLIKVISPKHNLVYDEQIWSMTEQEAYKYVIENNIDAIFFFPRDYNEEKLKQGEKIFTRVSSNLVSQEDLAYIIQNKRFLDRIYRQHDFTYFRDVMSRKIITSKKIYYFKILSPVPPAELFEEGIDISFLESKL